MNRITLSIVLLSGLPLVAHAQCGGTIVDPEQGHAFVVDPTQESVHAATRWDPDGEGPKQEWLVVAGQFRRAATQISQSVVAWDGVRWHPMDAGLPAPGGSSPMSIIDLEDYNGTLVAYGSGLGANTSNVMKWNGASWEQLGNTIVYGTPNRASIDMAVHNGELYVAGAIGYIPVPPTGLPATPVLRRVGESWETVGPRLYGSNPSMSRLESAPEGLYGAGSFIGVGVTGSQVVLNNVALWNGSQWVPLGDGLNNAVRDTAYFNGQLYVVGTFTQSGATPLPGIARWDGTQWHAVGDGSQGTATTIELHEGRVFITATSSGVTRVLRLDDASWTEVARPGQAPAGVSTVAAMSALVSDPLGLLVLGRYAAASNFKVGGGAVIRDDGALRALGGGFDTTTQMVNYNGRLITRATQRAGNAPVTYSAQWDGRGWTDAGLPSGSGTLATAGSRLLSYVYSPGTYNITVREFQNGAWVVLTGSFQFQSNVGRQMVFAELNGELYAAGAFLSIDNRPIKGLARWNGVQWSQVASGLDWTGASRADESLAIVDGSLYIAGSFDRVGDQAATGFARWDGTSLVPLVDANVTAHRNIVNWNNSVAGIVTINTPSGPAARVARWTGAAWDIIAPIPSGPTPGAGSIAQLLPIDASLYALYEETARTYIIKLNAEGDWDRVTDDIVLDISSVTSPRNFTTDALVFNNEIHVFGDFSRQGDHVANNWARFSADGVPLIITQPQDAVAPCGEPIELRATVANGYDADGELEYQWYRNGDALTETQFVRGVNTDTLTIPSLAQPFTGFYSVTVTNACGTATSREVMVTGDSLDCRVCAPCAADFDLDGGVTADDIASFFSSFETGNSCADVDHDGSVTGSDLAAFFTLYEAGGC